LVMPDHGGYQEVLRASRAGVLLDPASPGALARTFEELLADPEKRMTLGNNGIKASRGIYSMDTMARNIQKAYRELL